MSILGSLNSVAGSNPSTVVPGFSNASEMNEIRDTFMEAGASRKQRKRNRRARRRMRRRAIQEQNALGYAGMFKNQANAAAQAMQQEQPVGAVNAIQNAVTNAVQPPMPNPYDMEPSMGAAFMPAANEVANLQDPATRSFGIAGLGANAVFGGPLARQRSMSNKYIKKIN